MLGIDSKILLDPKGIIVKNHEEVEDAAIALRKKWKLGEDPLPNIVDMLESHQIKVFIMEADPAFSGMSTILKSKIGVIVLNQHPAIPVVRQRFTALHELAHLYLNLSDLEEKKAEKLCDHFAASMLIIPGKLKEQLGNHRQKLLMEELHLLAGQYGISLAAIVYHAATLGIITASYHKFFMIQYNKYKTRQREFNVYHGTEKSTRFLQLLFRAVAEEVISTSKGASLNNQKLGDFRDILDKVS
jgi:Zn-dependent peptidase ImmA (M78 family)